MQAGKKTVIFLLLFSIFSVSITIAAIIYNKVNWVDTSSTVTIDGSNLQAKSKNKEKASEEIGKLTEMTETYSSNPLKVKEIVYTTGNSTDSTYQEKVKVIYPEISNLKDQTIRTNINNQIKEKVFSYFTDNDLNNADIKHITIEAKVTANYSDVMSVGINITKENKDGKEENFSGLNYRLQNGEQIKFKNIFISGASIKSIVRHNAYNSLAWEYKNAKITDMSKVDYHKIYDDLYDVMKSYETEENPEFYFDEKEVNVKLNKKKIKISMIDDYKQIGIYSKYISSTSLYNEQSLATNIPLFTQRDEYSEMNVYMVVNKNLIIDMNLNVEDLDRDSAAINTAIANYRAALNSSISALKDLSKKEKRKYVYFIARITPEIDTENNKIIFNENTYKYTAYDEAQFGVYILSPILSEKRKSVRDLSKVKFDLSSRSIKIENLSSKVEYNLTTGNLYGENEVDEVEPITPEDEEEKEEKKEEKTEPKPEKKEEKKKENTNTTNDENINNNDQNNVTNKTNSGDDDDDDSDNITATITY